MAKAMRAAAMKAMKAVSKGTKQAIVPTKAMRAAAMKAMKVVSKEAKEQAFVATKAMRKAKAAAPAPKKAMKLAVGIMGHFRSPAPVLWCVRRLRCVGVSTRSSSAGGMGHSSGP